MLVRKAELKDLLYLVEFTAEEAREAEGSIKIPDTIEKGIKKALEDNSVALYREVFGAKLSYFLKENILKLHYPF